jgi:SAGA-associated factor 29
MSRESSQTNIGSSGKVGGMATAAGSSSSRNVGKAGKKTAHFSRSYPRGVGIDFRKLSNCTLTAYIDHHGVSVRSGAPPSELAVGVARHFEALDVNEDEVIGGFLARLSGNEVDYVRDTADFHGIAPSLLRRKRRRAKKAARPGEQVAAKVTRTDENGSWILASVQKFVADTETYDVQDEDDPSKLIRLPWNHVMRLSTGSEGIFHKGTEVMAIFPETTSFYRAIVSKQPVWRKTSGSPIQTIVKELIVKFEDDEDEQGNTPHRRVPSRYVIPVPSRYFFEDEDDIDLSSRAAKML